jgi:hypothetical protein
VHDLTDCEVADLAREAEEVTKEREELKSRKKILEASRKAFLKTLNPRALAVEDEGREDHNPQQGPKRLRRNIFA